MPLMAPAEDTGPLGVLPLGPLRRMLRSLLRGWGVALPSRAPRAADAPAMRNKERWAFIRDEEDRIIGLEVDRVVHEN